MRQVYALIVLFFASFALTACDSPQLQDVVENTIDGVVVVYTSKTMKNEKGETQKGQGLGTGFFIKDNLIVTNNHVIDGADEVLIKNSKSSKTYKATVIAHDMLSDLAILSINDWYDYEKLEKWKALDFAPSNELKRGQRVWAFGHPWGLEYTVSQGIISSIDRKVDKSPQFFLQVDAKIYQGNSGGPLLDMKGRVIGVNTKMLSNTGGSYGFSLAGDFVQKVVKQLRETNSTFWVKLGVVVGLEDGKLNVHDLDPKGLAKRYGVEKNDKLIRIISSHTRPEGKRLTSLDDLLISIALLDKNEVFWLQVQRDGENKLLPMVAQNVT